MNIYSKHFMTPYGEMIVAVDDDNALVQVVFPNGHDRWANAIMRERYHDEPQSSRCDYVIAQLDEYFAGKRTTFDIPLKPMGTEFQKQVWNLLLTIPYGSTTSYKRLAMDLGNLAAIRAVGGANGTNPIPIIIPCHRVIGADGSLTGFGGGLPLKEALLTLEGATYGQAAVEKTKTAQMELF